MPRAMTCGPGCRVYRDTCAAQHDGPGEGWAVRQGTEEESGMHRLSSRCSAPWLMAASVVVSLVVSACSPGAEVNPKVPPGAKSSGGNHAVIETSQGSIE